LVDWFSQFIASESNGDDHSTYNKGNSSDDGDRQAWKIKKNKINFSELGKDSSQLRIIARKRVLSPLCKISFVH
jgi:hypothetical protein